MTLRALSRAVEQSATAVLITNAAGTIEFANRAAGEIYGHAVETLLGANPRIFKSERTPPETYQAMWSTILAGRVWRGELVNCCGDGRIIHVGVSISPVLDASGAISHFVSIAEDVSARVETERLQEELRERLRRVERMQVMGAMAGGIASDFNNILVAILGFSGLGKTVVRSIGGPDRVVSYFEEIETAGERARELVRQLLTFARGGVARPTAVRVADVARQVADAVALSASASQQVSLDVADDLPRLEIDPLHLQRLLSVLCRNALEAMDGAGTVSMVARTVSIAAVRICASCHAEFSGEFLRIAVTDQGRGMPASLREHVFEPFFTTKDTGVAAGMGLPVAHGLTHVYGGHLELAAMPDRGTEVAILFPRSLWIEAA